MYQSEKFPGNRQKRENLSIANFEASLKNKERAFYAGDLRYCQMLDFLRQADVEDEGIEKKETLINLYSGMAKQEEINMDAVRFNLSLQDKADSKGIEYENLTREEVEAIFDEYEKKDVLEKNEEDAISFYEDALVNWQDNFFVDKQKIETLICDIKYRKAKRIKDVTERKEALNKIKAQYRSVAQDIFDKGLRAELQFTYLVNDWAQKEGRDYLIEAYGAMPLDDHKEKVDVEIITDGKILNVNLKSFRSSSDVSQFNEELLRKEEEKIGISNIELVVLESDEIQELWRLMGEETPDAKEKRRIKKLSKSLLSNLKDGILLKKLAKQEAPKRIKKGPTKKQLIERHSNILNLKTWGYLSEESATDVDAIMAAKRKLEVDLKDNKIFEKLRTKI